MDKNNIIYACEKCLYEKQVLFYTMCEDDYSMGFDLIDENLSRQRDVENFVYPKCNHKGFVNKLSLKRKNENEK